MAEERFGRPVVETLAKGAGNHCSNPECGVLTVAAAHEEDRALVIGEAAHIFGARPGSARFDPAMSDADRSDSTNGVWLCRNCHKVVDADAAQYPAELLFEWRRDHERDVRERLGKAGALRQKMLARRLEGFEGCSYLAQQIIIDKPDFWEHKLTAELLRAALHPIRQRWEALDEGLYAYPYQSVARGDAPRWLAVASREAINQTQALNGLLNGKLQASWGPPGEPGSEHEIHRVCGLMTEACQRLLAWEEKVRFTNLAEPFEELSEIYKGTCGPNLKKVCAIPEWLSGILSSDPTQGQHTLELEFDLPEGWAEHVSEAADRADARLADYV